MQAMASQGLPNLSYGAERAPGIAAKTGTAETGAGANDSWIIAYQANSDIAVACLVEGGGHGDAAAGPAIAAMFGALK
jgi:cell division protein FtsI/penicillin-binding protein 2